MTRDDKKNLTAQNKSTGKDQNWKDTSTRWTKHTDGNKHEIDKHDEKKEHKHASEERKRN
eukprot:3148075-Amphidinium_carterae.1